jgi:hypothetical protein
MIPNNNYYTKKSMIQHKFCYERMPDLRVVSGFNDGLFKKYGDIPILLDSTIKAPYRQGYLEIPMVMCPKAKITIYHTPFVFDENEFMALKERYSWMDDDEIMDIYKGSCSFDIKIDQSFYLMSSKVSKRLYSMMMGVDGVVDDSDEAKLFTVEQLEKTDLQYIDKKDVTIHRDVPSFIRYFCNLLSDLFGFDRCYSKSLDNSWQLKINNNGFRLPIPSELRYALFGNPDVCLYRELFDNELMVKKNFYNNLDTGKVFDPSVVEFVNRDMATQVWMKSDYSIAVLNKFKEDLVELNNCIGNPSEYINGIGFRLARTVSTNKK